MKDSLTSTVAHRRGTQRMETSLNLSFLDIHPKRGRMVWLDWSWLERNSMFWRRDFLEFWTVFFPFSNRLRCPNDPSVVQSGDEGSGDEASKPRLSVAEFWQFTTLIPKNPKPLGASQHLSILVQFIPINCSRHLVTCPILILLNPNMEKSSALPRLGKMSPTTKKSGPMKRDLNSQAKIGRCERFLLPTGLRKDEKKENEF